MLTKLFINILWFSVSSKTVINQSFITFIHDKSSYKNIIIIITFIRFLFIHNDDTNPMPKLHPDDHLILSM